MLAIVTKTLKAAGIAPSPAIDPKGGPSVQGSPIIGPVHDRKPKVGVWCFPGNLRSPPPVLSLGFAMNVFAGLPRLLGSLALVNRWFWVSVLIAVMIVLKGAWGDPLLGQSLVATNSSSWQYGQFPVENFSAYTSPFGYRSSPTSAGQQEFHNGLDMAAPLGSYVRSWWGGTVAELSDNTACGTRIAIASGSWTHIYCHLQGSVIVTPQGQKVLSDPGSEVQLVEGQTVTAGMRIGRVGMTGRTTGPHLHWTLKYNGNYIDPALVLQAMYQRIATR